MLGGFFKKLKKSSVVSRKHMQYQAHKEGSRKIILERINYFSPICGVSYNRVAIRNQKSRWGSCSSKKNLNFNYRLAFLPKEICDYVVVHELCHLKEMNHGEGFWLEVEKVVPNYRANVSHLRNIERSLAIEKFDIHTKYEDSYFSDFTTSSVVN